MNGLNYNKIESGLELLNVTPLRQAHASDWLNLEKELRKIYISLLKKNKVALIFSLKKIDTLRKSIAWPNPFFSILAKLSDNTQNNTLFLVSKILKVIWSEYFDALPLPGYWEYEELIQSLEKVLKFVRERNFKAYFQRILNLIDNHKWPSELRHQLEDLAEECNPGDLSQGITKVIKKIKKTQPIPVF